jgi:hypothetical protein
MPHLRQARHALAVVAPAPDAAGLLDRTNLFADLLGHLGRTTQHG